MDNIVYFDSSIYDLNSVRQAVTEYAKLARIQIDQEKDGIKCIFSDCKYDLKLTIREFSNYCLDLTVHNGNVWEH